MKTRPFLLHALSPLHAGTGQAAGVIDLPIVRMRSTGIPIVPGSQIKGVLRDAREADSRNVDDGLPDEEQNEKLRRQREEFLAVFGPDTDRASDHAGALVAGDARLLALPVRSFKGTFAWVSSPLLLDLAKRDLAESNHPSARGLDAPEAPGKRGAWVPSADEAEGSINIHRSGKDQSIFLEDLDFAAKANDAVKAWAAFLAPLVAPAGKTLLFARRFVVVSDEAMTFLWETATQIDTRVRIDSTTRTVAKGALWTEESLPPETLLIGLFAAEHARRSEVHLRPEAVLERALPTETILQFGGKATVGRGRCRIVPFAMEAQRSVTAEAQQ